MTKLTSFALATALSLTAFSAPAAAQVAKLYQAAILQEDNAEERIAMSGKLRMLSQRIPSAACFLAAGVDREGSAKLLNSSVGEFEKIINALEFGDSALGIQGSESRRLTIAKIQETRDIWQPFKEAATGVVNADDTDANLQILLSQNMKVLEAAQILVEELVGQYSNSPSSVHADLFLVDIAGRQRMLTQKMSKEACMLATSTGGADTADSLNSTMKMFDLSLEALRFGMPELGVKAPPNPTIAAGLVDVHNEWNAVKPALETVLAGDALEAGAAAQKFQGLNQTMAIMNKVVGLYVEAVKPST